MFKDKFIRDATGEVGTYKKVWKSELLEDLVTLALLIGAGIVWTIVVFQIDSLIN